MFKLIYSSEDYLLDRRVAEMRTQLELTAGDVETVIVDSDNITAEQLLEQLDFSPLFATARLVVLHKLPLWDEGGRRSQLLSQVKDNLLNYFQSPPDGQWVVATAGKISMQNPLVAELKKLSALEEIKPPTAGERLRIIKLESTARGLMLGENELKAISEAGQNLYFICSMFDKWTLLPGLKIDGQLLQLEGIGADSEGAIFAFTDAIILGQGKKALLEMRRLQEAGEPGLKILATVNRQLMTLAKVKGWGEEGRLSADIAVDIGDKKGFRTKRLMQDAERISWQRLRLLFGLICKTDVSIKTSRFSESMALEYLAISAAHQA
ncbi:MAG: DNA polymerase III subunit delta [Methylocystaceae bacterium]